MCATTGPGKEPPAAAYFYSPDRGSKHPAGHLVGFNGFLHADAYAGFEALYQRPAANARHHRGRMLGAFSRPANWPIQ